MRITKPFAALLQSRKFWLSLLAFINTAILYAQNEISAEAFVGATVALVGLLVSAIAYEDASRNQAHEDNAAS